MSTLPSSGSMRPIMAFIKVDLPAPLRPISPTRDRGGRAALARSRMTRPPRRWVIFRKNWKRSEEHTSELQSLMRISYAVFCLKKKKTIKPEQTHKEYKENHQERLQ